MKHVSLSICDYDRNNLCVLYDSYVQQTGSAHEITVIDENTGWKELNFKLPFVADKNRNFRWDYIKNEYMIKLIEGDKTDYYLITAPTEQKGGQSISNSVHCPHISANLKTKNTQ